MNKFRKPKIRLMLPKLEFNKLLKPIAIDIEIACNKKISVIIKVINKSLQAFKSDLTSSFLEMIKQKIKENGWLTEKLIHLHRKQGLYTYFMEKVTLAMKDLKQAVIEYYRLEGIIE